MKGRGSNLPVPIPSQEGGSAFLENTGSPRTKYSISLIHQSKVFAVNYQQTYYSISVGVVVFHQNEVRGGGWVDRGRK
jgi:hypothetical protein